MDHRYDPSKLLYSWRSVYDFLHTPVFYGFVVGLVAILVYKLSLSRRIVPHWNKVSPRGIVIASAFVTFQCKSICHLELPEFEIIVIQPSLWTDHVSSYKISRKSDKPLCSYSQKCSKHNNQLFNTRQEEYYSDIDELKCHNLFSKYLPFFLTQVCIRMSHPRHSVSVTLSRVSGDRTLFGLWMKICFLLKLLS